MKQLILIAVALSFQSFAHAERPACAGERLGFVQVVSTMECPSGYQLNYGSYWYCVEQSSGLEVLISKAARNSSRVDLGSRHYITIRDACISFRATRPWFGEPKRTAALVNFSEESMEVTPY